MVVVVVIRIVFFMDGMLSVVLRRLLKVDYAFGQNYYF